jgi:hypothetical protein
LISSAVPSLTSTDKSVCATRIHVADLSVLGQGVAAEVF